MLNFKKTVLAAAFISMVPTASYAQLEEVLVTATKRVSSVQDLPFSINAMTEQDINRSGSTNIEELSRNVAGLTIQNLGPGQSQVAIHGVSAGQIVRDQPGVKEQVGGIYRRDCHFSVIVYARSRSLRPQSSRNPTRPPRHTVWFWFCGRHMAPPAASLITLSLPSGFYERPTVSRNAPTTGLK